MAVTEPNYQHIRESLQFHGLEILGGFHPSPSEPLPKKAKSLLLLGPNEGFWDVMKASSEIADKAPDPIDRWSRRIISAEAEKIGGKAVFPFDGPPYHPFYTWAMKTGRIWPSPVKLAVHDTFGLFVSFRGALLLPFEVQLPQQTGGPPCRNCSKPCLTACPVEALTETGYDDEACHSFLDAPDGKYCMSAGCAVRRACPVGQEKRPQEQSAFHMRHFHKT